VLGSGSSEYEHGQTDFRGHQHDESDSAHDGSRQEPWAAQPADPRTSGRQTNSPQALWGVPERPPRSHRAVGEDQDADGAEGEADQKNDKRIERPRSRCPYDRHQKVGLYYRDFIVSFGCDFPRWRCGGE
jgi:hypothetical protein